MAGSRNRPLADLLQQVGAFILPRLLPADRVCIGLSGGCDSVVLLHLLSRLELEGRLSAIHVHHGLSPNADAWADFCAAYCSRLSVPLRVERVKVDGASPLGLEAAARSVRYAAFSGCPAEVLVLAQHQGDQAETLLFNLLRGAGVAGAAAIPEERHAVRQRILRPLLACTREEIEAYARSHGLNWIEDESNADTRHARNFLRHEILPVLERRFPAASRSLARSAGHFAEADELLSELAEADWRLACDGGEAPSMRRLRCLSPLRLKNLLRYRLRVLGWRAPGAQRLDEFVRQLLTAAPDRHPGLDLPDGSLRVVGGRLRSIANAAG